ncbi:hypothetical protein C437_01775 [Haloarcula vallismortis ATCC 29715]|uniref:Uncharacterized protein n=1 Tax=Haloarcula vallismortis ATCC 29715 TaxID=662477 RepID=M0JRL0_HALVA|nr:hypothetical protein C437_01775 [Haloarcula vallismortis ATCC 29715]
MILVVWIGSGRLLGSGLSLRVSRSWVSFLVSVERCCWGFLAALVASFFVFFFRVLESVLRFVFSVLQWLGSRR